MTVSAVRFIGGAAKRKGATARAARRARAFFRRHLGLDFGGNLRLRHRLGEREAFALALICALDMYTTLWWVMSGHATEANPLLSWTFAIHPAVFVAVKCLSFGPALVLAQHLARRHPALVARLLRLVIVGYVGVYLVGTFGLS